MRKVLFIPLFITVIVAQTVDYDTDIQPLWNGNCTSCHVYGHSSGLNLTSGQSYNNLVDVASSGNGYGGALRVVSGDPENSVLYDKITNGGTYGGQMPPNGLMSSANRTLVQTWINELSSTDTTIYTIQSGSFPDGTPVTIRGVVTAGTGETPDGGGNSIYIQDGQGEYSGINIYAPDYTFSRGDSVEIVGTTKEYYDKTEIENVTNVTVIETNVALPDPEILSLDQADWEPWEGVLIQAQNVTVSNDDAGYGEWYVSDGTDSLKIDNSSNDHYTYSPTNGDVITSITGPLNYSYSSYKLIPRDDDDIICLLYTSPSPRD